MKRKVAGRVSRGGSDLAGVIGSTVGALIGSTIGDGKGRTLAIVT